MGSIFEYIRQGKKHEREGLGCQDAVCGEEQNGVIAIAAADASSDSEFGKKGAESAVEALKELLLNHFQNLYEMEKGDLQYNVIIRVRKKHYELCEKYGLELNDLKTTLMAFAYEKSTNRAILVHLGDGFIVIKEKNEYRVVSYPENAGNRYRTFMTSTIPVSSKINVYQGEIQNLQQAFLMTDGWCEFINKKKRIIDLLREHVMGADGLRGEDDLGLIWLNLDDE